MLILAYNLNLTEFIFKVLNLLKLIENLYFFFMFSKHILFSRSLIGINFFIIFSYLL